MGDQDRKMQLKVGEIVEGTVKSLTKFGANFVDAVELILYYIVKPFQK